MDIAPRPTPPLDLNPACITVLTYLGTMYTLNERSEVSLQELVHELTLERDTARECITTLVQTGLAEADLFPTNIWAKISPTGRDYLEG